MSDIVEQRIDRVISLVHSKIKTYLELCESPIEKMFLLNYFETIFDSMTASWFSYGLTEQNKPFFQYPDPIEDDKYYPDGLKWYEPNNIRARRAISSHLIELYPQYEIKDDNGKVKYRIDFAIFYPRTDEGLDKIKIAIECDGHDFHEKTKEQAQRDKEKDRFLQSKGWLIARFTGSEIYRKDLYDLIQEIDNLALSKDYELFKEFEKQKNNWRYN
jgi:very-short-patch-repair endonuclease